VIFRKWEAVRPFYIPSPLGNFCVVLTRRL
jgi:hypothetical protein